MGCDCKKTYSIGMGCCQPVLAPADNYYTKYQTELKIEEAISGLTGTTGCCITPEEVDEKISAATDGMATEQWVEDKHYITGVDLSDYALKSEIPTVPTSNTAFTNDAGYLTEHQPIKTINGESLIGTGNITIEGGSGVTSAECQTMIDNSISGKVDVSTFQTYSGNVNTELSGKQNRLTFLEGGGVKCESDEVELDIPTRHGASYTNVKINGTGTASGYYSVTEGSGCYATGNYSHAEGSNTSATTVGAHAEGIGTLASGGRSHAEGLYTIAQNENEHASGMYNLSLTGTSAFDYSGHTLFTVGNGSDDNDRKNALDVRRNGDIYIQSGDTTIKLQDHLGGGGTTYTAGDGINITNNVISTTTKFWCGTQAEYEQISPKDNNTVYMIHD